MWGPGCPHSPQRVCSHNLVCSRVQGPGGISERFGGLFQKGHCLRVPRFPNPHWRPWDLQSISLRSPLYIPLFLLQSPKSTLPEVYLYPTSRVRSHTAPFPSVWVKGICRPLLLPSLLLLHGAFWGMEEGPCLQNLRVSRYSFSGCHTQAAP